MKFKNYIIVLSVLITAYVLMVFLYSMRGLKGVPCGKYADYTLSSGWLIDHSEQKQYYCRLKKKDDILAVFFSKDGIQADSTILIEKNENYGYINHTGELSPGGFITADNHGKISILYQNKHNTAKCIYEGKLPVSNNYIRYYDYGLDGSFDVIKEISQEDNIISEKILKDDMFIDVIIENGTATDTKTGNKYTYVVRQGRWEDVINGQ